MSCKIRMFSACFIAGENLPHAFDWTEEFSIRWNANSPYMVGACVRPSTLERQTGFEYVSSGGQSGAEEPEWPTTLGAEVVDGSITWTAAELSFFSLRERVSSDTWPAVSGFTIDPATPIDEPGRQITHANIGSESVANVRVPIRCEVLTTAGNDYVGVIKMKVE